MVIGLPERSLTPLDVGSDGNTKWRCVLCLVFSCEAVRSRCCWRFRNWVRVPGDDKSLILPVPAPAPSLAGADSANR